MASNVVQTGFGNIPAASKRKESSAAEDREFVVERITATTRSDTLSFFGNRAFSIVLTGSLARDEGTIVSSGGERQIAGDAEFLAIFTDGRVLPDRELLDRLCESIEKKLLSGFSIRCSVHVSAGHPGYLNKMSPHIFGYELRTCGRVICGDPGILDLIPKFSSRDIPAEDGWRLLSNRMVEHLEIAADLPAGECDVPARLAYHTVKMLLDMVTSVSVFLGVYEPSYRQRQSRLETILPKLSGPLAPLPVDCNAFLEDSAYALQKKLESNSAQQISWDLWARMISYAAALWRWELLELCSLSGFSNVVEVVSKWNRQRPFLRRLRCWLPLVRVDNWLRSVANSPRWLSMFAKGSPRDHTYLAAYQLFSKLRAVSIRQIGDSVEDAELEYIAGFLPIRSYQSKQNSWGAWRRLADDIARNFHLFVENTTT